MENRQRLAGKCRRLGLQELRPWHALLPLHLGEYHPTCQTIWRIANDLRGSVDGWDFKSYVLGMLFYRFISENITQRANALVKAAEGGTFDYTRMADDEADVARSQKVSEIGYFILPSELFTNVQQRAAQDENLNITLGISSPRQ